MWEKEKHVYFQVGRSAKILTMAHFLIKTFFGGSVRYLNLKCSLPICNENNYANIMNLRMSFLDLGDLKKKKPSFRFKN